MNKSTRDVLLGLAAKRDADSLAHVLDSLSREAVDEDFVDVFRATMDSVAKLANKITIEELTMLQDALHGPYAVLGTERYLSMVMEAKADGPYLDIVLSAMEPSSVASLAEMESVNDALAALNERMDMGESASLWLFKVGLACENSRPMLVRNLLRIWGQQVTSDGSEKVSDAVRRLASDVPLVLMVRDDILRAESMDVLAVVGLFSVLGMTGDVQHVDVIGPFVEDVGAWTIVSRAVFSAKRIEGILGSFEKSGVAAVTREAAAGDALNDVQEFSQRLSADPRFHAGMARILGGRATLFAIGRLFVETKFIAAVKSIVADRDAPIRLAAVEALWAIGSKAAVPYLLSGTIDRNKGVRKSADAACRKIMGEEAYQEHLDSLKEEVNFLRKRLKGFHDWAREALNSIEKTLKDAVDVAKSAPSRIGAATRKLFRRQEED